MAISRLRQRHQHAKRAFEILLGKLGKMGADLMQRPAPDRPLDKANGKQFSRINGQGLSQPFNHRKTRAAGSRLDFADHVDADVGQARKTALRHSAPPPMHGDHSTKPLAKVAHVFSSPIAIATVLAHSGFPDDENGRRGGEDGAASKWSIWISFKRLTATFKSGRRTIDSAGGQARHIDEPSG
ncbi:hypothetical protein GGD83_001694 [Rhodoblastus sphagnicola]|nr:hypothetical protein [Rhodoblastus sphagnicola]MBB4197901.1 hypothetical protein [Rhodoblastus sphagnicola]